MTKFPTGLFKAEINFDDGSKDICFCEYTGIDDGGKYKGHMVFECNGCGKEVSRVHCFNIFDDVEHYLGLSKTRSGEEYETYLFGTTCVKKHVKVLETVCPSRWV